MGTCVPRAGPSRDAVLPASELKYEERPRKLWPPKLESTRQPFIMRGTSTCGHGGPLCSCPLLGVPPQLVPVKDGFGTLWGGIELFLES